MKSKSSVQLGYEVNFQCYALSLFVLQPILSITAEFLLVFLLVAGLLIWQPLTGCVFCLGFLPLVAVYIMLIRKRMKQYGKAEMDARRQQSRTVVEAFRGYAELEVNDAFESLEKTFLGGLDEINANRLRMDMFNKLPGFVSEAAIVAGLSILLMVTQNNLTLVSGVFAVAALKIIPSVRGMMSNWSLIQTYSSCLDVVEEGIRLGHNEAKSHSFERLPFDKEIRIDNVSFCFPDGENVLNDFSYTIKKGDHVGVRGESGSGKSTLFNLLLGLYKPTEGKISIDGITLSDNNVKSWQRHIGYVPQEIFIIKGSLAENIALGQGVVDEKRIWQVLDLVQLTSWVEKLPDGINTELGEYGSRMSGGQKQRIGIARALYKQADVLFFDEATSALDNKTEKEITESISQLSKTRSELTIIVIAHRESSLEFCDRVITLTK